MDRSAEIKNNAFRGAYWKGEIARSDGKPRTACPYDEGTATVGKGREVPTWGRAFANYWRRGWDDKNEEIREDQAEEMRSGPTQ